MSKYQWPPERVSELRKLASNKLAVSEIAPLMRLSPRAVANAVKRFGVPCERYTAAEAAERRARESAEDTIRRRLKRQAERKNRICLRPGTSKTSRVYRDLLPRLPADTTRNQLRAMLHQAVLNTQGARA